MKLDRKWLVAVFVAALYPKRESWKDYPRGVLAVWRAIFHRKVSECPPDITEARRRVCEACPLYFKPLETCGSPLAEDHPELGCYCYMGAMAKMRDGHCWLRENTTADGGWPDELL